MKPLLVLLIVFVISLLTLKIVRGTYQFTESGRIAMAMMLVFTAIRHFAFTKGMAMMLPSFIPFKTAIVYLTGIIELTAAFALFIPKLRVATGWLLIIFFVLWLPANIYAAAKHINYQKGTFDGPGLSYLWFRIPLQLLFILWVYYSILRADLLVNLTRGVQ